MINRTSIFNIYDSLID